ncbi:hypothetical protein B0H19DRAFT_1077997 [Mycena capillaripes]|nr:hypothetical protein B0H19DRAFT_1077997 [Mycena capillaripes]
MLPLQRPQVPESIHSWWSDSNPGGAAFPLHKLAKPLSKFLHHRAVSSIIAKSRSGPLSKGNLEVLTWYLQSRDKDIGPSTKVLILQEMNRRALWEAQTKFIVEENVHHATAQLLGSANNNMLAWACTLLGTLAQWRSGNAAIVDVNPCYRLVWLITYNDSPVVHKQAVYALTRVGQYSAAGARALIKAGAVSLTSTLLRSEDSDILEWTSRMAVDISHSGEFLNNMSEVNSERTTRRITTNNHNRDRARLSPAVDGIYHYCPEIQECDSTPPPAMTTGPSWAAQVVHREDIIEPFPLPQSLGQDRNSAESRERARFNPPAYSPYPSPASSPQPTDPISLRRSPVRREFLPGHRTRHEKAAVDRQQSYDFNTSHGAGESVLAIEEVIGRMGLTMADESDMGSAMTVSTGQSASANIISRLTHNNTEPMIQERCASETQSSKHVRLDSCLSINPDFEDGVNSNTYIPDVHEPKSDSITPPPEIIHLERKASRIEVIGNSYSDGSAMPKKKQSKKKARVSNQVVEMAPADHKLILMIPCAEHGTQRQQLTHATTFSEALDIIHEALGCADVDKKPALMYKLNTAGKQDEAIRLSSDADWAGCREEVKDAAKDKKKAISVRIIVTDQYLHSLRVKLGVKATDPKITGKQNVQIFDLDHAQSGDDDFDDGLDIMQKEKRYLEQLESQYGKCHLCGPTKICKITIGGAHYHLSNNQLRDWSHSLAVGTHTVTLKTPPNDTIFSMFFENSKAAPVEPASTPPIPMAQYMAMNLMNPFGPIPWAMPTLPPSFHGNPTTPIMPTPAPLTSWAASSRLSPTFPSSDHLDIVAGNPYPEISYFLTKLNELQPRRQLLKCIPKFEELDFYNIDELVKLGLAAELAHITSISLGNATYILEKVKGEIKRVDREIKSKA